MGEIPGDRGAEDQEQRECADRARDGCSRKHEQARDGQLGEWDDDRQRPGEPLRSAEVRDSLAGGATVRELGRAGDREDGGEDEA